MTGLSKKLRRTQYLVRHLAELGQLLKREVYPEDLLTLEETEAILARSKGTKRAPAWKLTVPFEEKAGSRFETLVRRLGANYPGPVYLWTPLANDCGLPRPLSLADINFQFDFNLNPEGIIEVFADESADRMVLDYSLAEDDAKVLEVEVAGERWGPVQY